ncbi:MAG TPA: hypothetical protein VFN21_09610 [Acidimicrobiales bacterium]|nr:hypothetical protein [Acidimicrobiales bacterium]
MTDSNVSQPREPSQVPPAPGDSSENLLRHYANVLVRRWRWIALGVVVGLVAGIAATVFIKEAPVTTRYYKATNTLVQKDSTGNADGGVALTQAALQSESITLLDKVGQAVDLTRDDVSASLDATVRPNVRAIDVTAIATQPELAVRLADTGAETLRFLAQAEAGNTVDAQRKSLQDDLDSTIAKRTQLSAQTGGTAGDQMLRAQQVQNLDDDIQTITENLDNLPDSGSGFTLEVLQPATPQQINARGYNYRRGQNMNARSPLIVQNTSNSTAPDFDETDLSESPAVTPSTRIALGSAAGLVLGLISAFVIEAWDDRVRRRDRVEELTGLGVLTEIPHLSREQAREHHVAVEDDSTGAAAERYRAARTAITFAMEEQHAAAAEGAPVLMVTSPGPSEGKTTTVANLSAAFADAGYRVLVIDGDFRRPTVRRYLAPVPNLVSPDEPAASRIEGVSFLAGPHDAPTPEIANDLLAKAIATWHTGYDLVILDTPPILTTNDAVDLLESADAVLLVLRADRTRANAARRVAELLVQFRANVLGVVLNSCDRSEMNQYYGYGYGYGYGYLGKNSSKSGRDRAREEEASVSVDHATTTADDPHDASGQRGTSDQHDEAFADVVDGGTGPVDDDASRTTTPG